MATKKKILIVEDEKPIARALQLKLEKAGFEVELANDGEAGLKAIQGGTFDFIILDLVMPLVNGFEILEWLKSHKVKTPVFVVSNLGQSEDTRRAKSLGVLDYFVKSDIPLANIVKRVKEELHV